MQIYQEPQIKGSLQDSLGTGLQQLLQLKMGQMQKRHTQKEQEKAYEKGGYPGWYAYQDPQVQKELVKGRNTQQESQDFAQLMGQGQQQSQPDITQMQPQEQLQMLLNPDQGKNQGQINLEKALASLGGGPVGQQFQPQQQQTTQQKQIQKPMQQVMDYDRILANPKLKPEHRLRIEAMKQQKENTEKKLSMAERKLQHAEEIKERPFYEKTLKDYTESRSTLNELDRVNELVQSGKVSNPTEDSFQRWLGSVLKVNLSDLRGADTEEFDKLTTGFVKHARNWFPGRVTNADLKVFMKTIPTLSMTNEGKMRLIGSMKAAAEAQKIKYQATRELMKKNKGHLPAYAEMQVEEMIGPELDRLAKDFISGKAAPKLSKEAEAAMKRNWWMRWVQLFAGGGKDIAKTVGAAVEGIGNVAGGLAGFPQI